MDATLYFGKIYIVKWLDPDDLKSGRLLFEMLSDLLPQLAPKVQLEFKRVTSRDEFIEYVRSIKDDFRSTRMIPLLHVETHGCFEGIRPDGQPPIYPGTNLCRR
jgi:hypothetical protein